MENFSRHFESLEKMGFDIVNIDENGNIEIVLSEDNEHILQSFKVRASRKRLRRYRSLQGWTMFGL